MRAVQLSLPQRAFDLQLYLLSVALVTVATVFKIGNQVDAEPHLTPSHLVYVPSRVLPPPHCFPLLASLDRRWWVCRRRGACTTA
jgi:hypothetical protein